jgi:hypothetical protein
MQMKTDLTSSGSKPDLILGVMENYTFAQVEPFLVSLRQTGYTGDIVLFHHRVDPVSLEKIREFGVRLIAYRSLRAFPPGFRRKMIQRFSRLYYDLKWPCYGRAWTWLLSAVKKRHVFYRRFLEEEGGNYRRVLLADTRDVFFQSNPFSSEFTEDLLFFEESHPLDHGEFNSWWIKSHLGQETLDRLAKKTTLCSGTTMGTPAALCWYLDRTLHLMRTSARQGDAHGDQGLHNAVVYEHLHDCPYSIRICGNGCAQVYTLTQYLETKEIRRAPTGEVIDPLGRPVPIVHQYDRHPPIQEALLHRMKRGHAPAST